MGEKRVGRGTNEKVFPTFWSGCMSLGTQSRVWAEQTLALIQIFAVTTN